MRSGTDFRLQELARGLNVRDDPSELTPGESSSLYDVIRDGDGFRRRPGDTVKATSLFNGAQAQDMFWFDKLFMITNAGGVYVYDPTVPAITAIATASPIRPRCGMVQAPVSGGQGPYWIANQLGMRYTDGFTLNVWTAASGTLPLAAYATYAGNRVWLANLSGFAGVPDPASTMAFCDIGNPRAWPAANVVSFSPNDGEEITGIARIGEYVAVFKPSKAWLVYDLDTGANRPIGFGAGSSFPGFLIETPAGLLFGRGDGRLMITNGSDVKEFDDRLSKLLVYHFNLSPLSDLYLNAVYFRDHLYVQLRNFIYDYDLIEKAWWRHRIRASAASDGLRNIVVANAESPAGDATTSLYTLEGVIGQAQRLVRFMDDGSNNYGIGEAIVPKWRSGLLDLGTFARKRLNSLEVDGTGTADLATYANSTLSTIVFDNEGPGYTPASQLASYPARVLPTRTPTDGTTRRVLFEVNGATSVRTLTARLMTRGR